MLLKVNPIYRPFIFLALILVVFILSSCSTTGDAADQTDSDGEATDAPVGAQPTFPPTITPSPIPPTETPPPPSPTEMVTELDASPTPQSEESGPPAVGELIYETDFRGGGWPSESYAGFGHIKTTNNGYELYAELQGLWMATTKVWQSTYYIEAEAFPTQCPVKQAWYGLVFHYRDNSHFRFFVVTCSGRYFLYEREEANRSTKLAEGDLPPGVNAVEGTHRVAVLVKGKAVRLYIDDIRLDKVELSGLPDGDVGPYVETVGAPVTVLFKRLVVHQAE